MLDDLKTFLPAAGLASRMQGIPKFLLPLYKEKTLLGFHLDNLLELKNNEVVIGTSPQFYNNLTNIYSEQNILEVESKSMVETVVKLDLDQNRTSLVVMPDTYFSDYEIVNQMRKKLSSTDLDVVLGLWKIKNDQKGKLGQCRIEGELIKKIIDKDPNCTEDFFWGLIMWKPKFNDYISTDDPHFGVCLNRSIEEKIKIGFVKSKEQYFDCGTFDEYLKLVKSLN